jgi:hypothetical protein
VPALYSTRFLAFTGAGPAKYTVPAGKRVVLKLVSAVNPSTSAQQCVLYIGALAIWVVSLPANSGAFAAGLHLVYNAGEDVQLANSSSVMTASAHGYLLDAP